MEFKLSECDWSKNINLSDWSRENEALRLVKQKQSSRLVKESDLLLDNITVNIKAAL